jgi:hypothetical protein
MFFILVQSEQIQIIKESKQEKIGTKAGELENGTFKFEIKDFKIKHRGFHGKHINTKNGF